ncbi:MAG: flagellar export protein FliJ [Bacillota bacterium]|nr:flagellar export protein FliJ [Bacillota bacterium]
MASFNFKLQKLLDIRLDKEEESKRAFKIAQEEKLSVENKLNTMVDNYKKFTSILTEGSVVEQKIRQHYLNALSFSINDLTSELEQKEKKLEEKRLELKQKQVERKTVEVLKEKQLLQFNKEQADIEQRNNDEFALYAYIRANHEVL